MAVPDFQSIMLPLLNLMGERETELSNSDVVATLGQRLNLSEDDLREMLPSGNQRRFVNRVAWAIAHFKKALLLEPTKRAHCQITQRGRDLLASKPERITLKLLDQYPEHRDFNKGANKSDIVPASSIQNDVSATITPSEALEEAYQSLRDELADELLEKLKTVSPAFFEQCVVELLVKMGYGGSRTDEGRAIGRTGDGGIDGIIKEDKLGLDVIYIQAKRWGTNTVGRPDIQQFAGALQGQRANKGIFITTSRFTEDAKSFVAQIGSKIVLIDGEQLAQLMIDHDVGVATAVTYQVKRIDSDYFSEGA